MKIYIRDREKQEKVSRWTGVGLTVAMHIALALILIFSNLTYLYPPPPEMNFLIDFTDEEEEAAKILETPEGREPEAENVDTEKPVELVQRSESPHVSTKPNLTPATKPDPHGDVEVPTPKQEEPALDPRAAFPGMAKKDTSLTAPHSASEASSTFKAGQSDGNIKEGKTSGSASASVKGRSVIGSLPKPTYNAQKEGIVVVAIKVDQYGTVTEAVAGASGTTVTDKELWAAARAAAMKAHFNQSADAPVLQDGTITYIFKLK